jgi:hypothetical protein
MVYNLSGVIPLFIINEYPKSGGTWLGQLLEMALDVPYPRNRFPLLRKSIMSGHYFKPGRMKNVIIVWRDGRDVMTSWYYQCCFEHEHDNKRLVSRTRKDLKFEEYDNIINNLPRFIEYVFTSQPNPPFTWADFVEKWAHRTDVMHTRYEDLNRNTAEELKRIIYELVGQIFPYEKLMPIVEELSFANQASKHKNHKNSFLRKGIVGDWRNNFSDKARVVFDQYAGDALIKLGYEKNHAWIKSV